jgi:hypothetical protein
MKWQKHETVAGHQFYPNGVCACGRRWVDIRNAGTEDLFSYGIAHVDRLSAGEIDQIRRKREEEDNALAAAMGYATGKARDAEPAPADDYVNFWMPNPPLMGDPFCQRMLEQLNERLFAMEYGDGSETDSVPDDV